MTASIAAAKDSLRRLLEREEGFVGVGIGAGAPAAGPVGTLPADPPPAGDRLIVLVVSRESAAFSKAPATHEGFAVVVEVVGRPRAL